jgi:hypothetical protein
MRRLLIIKIIKENGKKGGLKKKNYLKIKIS